MTGRILVVDAVPTNRIILRVKLAAAFYEVAQADTAASALDKIQQTLPDLVIISSDLPDMPGRDLCAALREAANDPHLPVVIIHSDNLPEERHHSLVAGADDVMTRPLDDQVMLARLRSLLRTRDAEAELKLREDTRRALGLEESPAEFDRPATVAFVPVGDIPTCKSLTHELSDALGANVELVDANNALRERRPSPDVIVIAEGRAANGQGLTLLAQIRANSFTRHSAVVYVARPHQEREAASALDMGANDLMVNGPDAQELAIRLRKQIARKRTNDRLREDMQDGLRAALTDPLTGLYNRRYTLPHLSRLTDRATQRRRPFSMLVLDLDFFKKVNDKHGHAAGDAVLVTLARRLKDNLRPSDLIARWGGEEFLVAMPDTDRNSATAIAERLCHIMAQRPIALPGGRRLTVTLSIGVSSLNLDSDDTPFTLIDKADQALYAAKNQGRNTVVLADTVRPMVPRRRKKPTFEPVRQLSLFDAPKRQVNGT